MHFSKSEYQIFQVKWNQTFTNKATNLILLLFAKNMKSYNYRIDITRPIQSNPIHQQVR